ncbi:hypothetical protein PG995_009157 [Apiospora arundinis]
MPLSARPSVGDATDYPEWFSDPTFPTGLESSPLNVSPTELSLTSSSLSCDPADHNGWETAALASAFTESILWPDPVAESTYDEGVGSTSVLKEAACGFPWYSTPLGLSHPIQSGSGVPLSSSPVPPSPPTSVPSLPEPDVAQGSVRNSSSSTGHPSASPPHSHISRLRHHNAVERRYRETVGSAIVSLQTALPTPLLPLRKNGLYKPTKAEIISQAATYIQKLEGEQIAIVADRDRLLRLLIAYRRVSCVNKSGSSGDSSRCVSGGRGRWRTGPVVEDDGGWYYSTDARAS